MHFHLNVILFCLYFFLHPVYYNLFLTCSFSLCSKLWSLSLFLCFLFVPVVQLFVSFNSISAISLRTAEFFSSSKRIREKNCFKVSNKKNTKLTIHPTINIRNSISPFYLQLWYNQALWFMWLKDTYKYTTILTELFTCNYV